MRRTTAGRPGRSRPRRRTWRCRGTRSSAQHSAQPAPHVSPLYRSCSLSAQSGCAGARRVQAVSWRAFREAAGPARKRQTRSMQATGSRLQGPHGFGVELGERLLHRIAHRIHARLHGSPERRCFAGGPACLFSFCAGMRSAQRPASRASLSPGEARMAPPAAAPAGVADEAAWVEAMLAAEGPLTPEQARAPATCALASHGVVGGVVWLARGLRAFAVSARGVTRNKPRGLSEREALTTQRAGFGGAAAASERAGRRGGCARRVPAAERAVAPRQERGAGGARAGRLRARRSSVQHPHNRKLRLQKARLLMPSCIRRGAPPCSAVRDATPSGARLAPCAATA